MSKRRCFYRWFFIVALLFVFDRFTKLWALQQLVEPLRITDWFSFEFMLNRGISLGLFHFDHPFGFFLVTALVSFILLAIIRWTWQVYRKGEPVEGQLFIIAGGISNVLDRIFFGGVIDFILFSWGTVHLPLFNVADVLIDIGVFLLVLQMLKSK